LIPMRFCRLLLFFLPVHSPSFSVTMYVSWRALRLLQNFALFSSTPDNRDQSEVPHLCRWSFGKNFSVTEHLMYLYYRSCFWVFVRHGTALRFQRWWLLSPLFPESRFWDVPHLVVHSSSALVWLFHTALLTTAADANFAKRDLAV
jgi:hypothetical protein